MKVVAVMLSILKEQLKALRKELGLTQKEISLVLRMPRGTYVHYELGKRAPDIDILMRIADLHQVSLDYLTGYSKRRPSLDEWLVDHPDYEAEKKIPASYRLSAQAKPDKASLKIADDLMTGEQQKAGDTDM
jgi:transcriptional regulator with XRE-family HTH domain